MPGAPGPGETRSMNVIEVSNLVKHYGNHTAVDGVSFSVEEGEIFAILGPNGAGKTTTVESISGLRTPDSGTISVLGLDPQPGPRRAPSRRRRPTPGERATGSDPGLGSAGPLRIVLPCAARLGAPARRPRARPTSATPRSASSRAARSSGCRSRWRWSAIRRSPSSTSSRPASTHRPGATRGSSSRTSAQAASRSSWSPTSWRRPSGWPIASR